MEQPPEEHKMSETFDNFGDEVQANNEEQTKPIKNECEDVEEELNEKEPNEEEYKEEEADAEKEAKNNAEGEIKVEVQEINMQGDGEVPDYSAMDLEGIVKSLEVELVPQENVNPNFSQSVKNNNHKFYLATINNGQPCSIMILNGVQEKKQEFGKLLRKLKNLEVVNARALLQLRGVVLLEKSAYFIFEYVVTNYPEKVKSSGEISETFKFKTLFHLIDLIVQTHDNDTALLEIRPSGLLLNNMEELRFLFSFDEFKSFNQHHENKEERKEQEFKFDRYRTPEYAIHGVVGKEQDIWVVGCLFVELFSNKQVWDGMTEEMMDRDLKKYYVPKIHKDIPKHTWNMICECLNPFRETRIEVKELMEHYSRLMVKLKISELAHEVEKYIANVMDVSKLNNTMEGEDPKAMRKCPMHPRNEAFLFCAQCAEVICEQCKKSIHQDHASKGVFFEYLDFINLARSRIHSYKEKFNRYIVDANVPKREIYDDLLKTNEENIEQLYVDQKAKIEEQFEYLKSILDKLREIEIEHLTRNRDYFKTLFNNILDNYTSLQTEIEEVQKVIENKEQVFLKFQDLDQVKKEETMKSVPKDENMLNFKKKNIIRYVTNFHRESSQIEKLKRYFETFIEKYKENKINDLVRVVEKKIDTIGKKYKEMDLNDHLKILISEFEQITLISSRNYFNSASRELFISVVNKNQIFSYNIDAEIYFVQNVDFKGMPINRFANYSRSLILNGNLLVNGGYDEENKVTLPYFFFYDRLNKTLTRLNDMLFGHSAHSIVYVPPNFVVVVSGSGISKCEKYDMENNSWSELPEINISRQNCTLYYYNKQYLYAFGGAYWDDVRKTFVYVETVERLDLGFGSVEGGKEWEQIQTYKIGKDLRLRKSVMSVLSYSANKILMVGGSVSYNTYSSECLLFDFEKNEFSLKEGIMLPRKTCFPNKTFMYSGDKAYQLDNDGNVYEFDFLIEKFTIIKENSVLKSTRANA